MTQPSVAECLSVKKGDDKQPNQAKSGPDEGGKLLPVHTLLMLTTKSTASQTWDQFLDFTSSVGKLSESCVCKGNEKKRRQMHIFTMVISQMAKSHTYFINS